MAHRSFLNFGAECDTGFKQRGRAPGTQCKLLFGMAVVSFV
ncbi:MAG: hypothetical protein ACI915_003602, partial [Gammaproteobacteria bacterium]